MKSDPDPYQYTDTFFQYLCIAEINLSITSLIVGLFIIFIFLGISALFSSSENAFFSLSPENLAELNDEDSPQSHNALKLINDPDRQTATRRLLATILLMNNLVNIFIVIYASYLFSNWIQFDNVETQFGLINLNFLFQVVFITFIVVLFGEIIPKIYATKNNLKIVRLMSKPLNICYIVFKPIIILLVKSSSIFDRYLKSRQHNISVEEISQAIDIADQNKEIEEKHILKGLINFGNTSVKQIMKPRTEVNCLEMQTSSKDLLNTAIKWTYSRIPIYEENFDQVKGILYIKDLLPHIHAQKEFDWHHLIRPTLFVPEHKKIDTLLEEFQDKRVHMAIVVDEYGGTSGIVTMEDILEEVFGEIKDEFDDEDLAFSKLDNNTYVFEGKTALHDIIKILNLPQDYFEIVKEDADTIGGLILEIHKKIPSIGDTIEFQEMVFTIESADNRKIKRVKLLIARDEDKQDI
ncbi:MAG: gliding motility-associated protein GldE [Bacteroidia bacterium]|nr:gliding motility-associated protein GldE [Bacteroidia bacterium]